MKDDAHLIVLEDNPLILLDMQSCLADLGYGQVLSASTLEETQALATAYPGAVALLDVDIRGKSSIDLATWLLKSGRRFAFLTGYGTMNLPPDLRSVPILRKPVQIADLAETVKKLLED